MIISWHNTIHRELGQRFRWGLGTFDINALHWGQRPGVFTRSVLVLMLMLMLTATTDTRLLEHKESGFSLPFTFITANITSLDDH